MNSSDKYWLSFWGICGALVVVTAVCIMTYWMDHNGKVVQLIKDGVDPVAVMCAL